LTVPSILYNDLIIKPQRDENTTSRLPVPTIKDYPFDQQNGYNVYIIGLILGQSRWTVCIQKNLSNLYKNIFLGIGDIGPWSLATV